MLLTLKLPDKLQPYGLYVYYVVHICDFGMLRVNTSKTNVMVFSYRNIDFDDFNVKLNDYFITQVASVKFIGAIIDNKLSWKDYVDYVTKYLKTSGS